MLARHGGEAGRQRPARPAALAQSNGRAGMWVETARSGPFFAAN